jgi:hypothetical protein
MVFKKASEPLEGEPVVSRLPELSSPVITEESLVRNREAQAGSFVAVANRS